MLPGSNYATLIGNRRGIWVSVFNALQGYATLQAVGISQASTQSLPPLATPATFKVLIITDAGDDGKFLASIPHWFDAEA